MRPPVHQPLSYCNTLISDPGGDGDVSDWAGITPAFLSAPLQSSSFSDCFSSSCSFSCPSARQRANGANPTSALSRQRQSFTDPNLAILPTTFHFLMVFILFFKYYKLNLKVNIYFTDEVSDLSSAVISGNDSTLGRPLNDSSPLPQNNSIEHRACT